MVFKKLFGYFVEPHFLDDRLDKVKEPHPITYRILSHLIHPVHNCLHTRHEQIPLGGDRYEVEHYKFNSLVTTDIIESDSRGNYKGKNEFKNQRFRLIKRTYIHNR